LMGEEVRRKRLFLAKHPLCCFCGGTEPAVTEDHIPARSFFTERRWPEGFVFPACWNCNAALGWTNRFAISCRAVTPWAASSLPEINDEFNAALTALVNNHPGILEELLPDFRDHGQFPTHRGLPGIKADGPQVRRAIENYARSITGRREGVSYRILAA
jgi:hypothetical protein